MVKVIHIHVGGKTKDAEPQPDAKTVASILRRCSLDAKQLSNNFEALARLVDSGEDKVSLSSARAVKESLSAIRLP